MPDRRELHAAAYGSLLAAAFLVLWAGYVAARKERELEALFIDAEKDIKQLRESKRQVEGDLANARAEIDRYKEGGPA